MIKPRRFFLNRFEDESGVSGEGYVAVGVELPSRRVIMEWLVSPYTISLHTSVQSVIDVHGHGGKTKIEWVDEKIDIPLQ